MRRLIHATLALLAATLAGCGSASDAPRPTTGQLAVHVTDAPFPASCFAEATVTVDRVEIQPAGTEGEGGWLTVTSTAAVWNLLDLRGGVSQTAAFATLPAGNYHQLRLIMSAPDAGVLTWTDGFQRSFTVPSGVVKVNPKPHVAIVPGVTTRLLLDFDLSRSWVQQGTPSADCNALKDANAISFKPVVRAVNLGALATVEGIVRDGAGTVTPGAEPGFPGVTVSVADGEGEDPDASTLTGDGSNGQPIGYYALLVAPGTYQLFFEAPGRVSQTASVTVEAGETRTMNWTIP